MASNASDAPVKYKLIFKHVPVPTNNERDYSLLQLFVDEPWAKEKVTKLNDWLTSQNIDVNSKNWYPLLESKLKNSPAVQNSLYSDEAYIDIATKLKNILPCLLNCNGDINYTTDKGQTILHVYLANDESCYRYSEWRGRGGNTKKSKVFDIIKTLLDKGASVDAIDKSGKTPLHVAIENSKFEVIPLMMDFFSNVDACDVQGNTVLHITVNRSLGSGGCQVKECTNIVRVLLSKGADPNRKNKKGMSAVQIAANKYNVDMLKMFKDHGAYFDDNLLLLVFRDNWYAYDKLMIEKTLEFLVNQGYDVNVKDKNGYSPIHYAATWDRAAEKLIKLGADVNCQTVVDRKTPLHLAAIDAKSKWIALFQSANAAVGALLRAGAYWDAVDNSGRRCFDYVLESGNSENVADFLRFGADINDNVAISLIMDMNKLQLRKSVLSHAVKLKAIGFPVAKVYESQLDLTSDLREERKECVEEVKKLKAYTISSGVSIYQFLHMSSRKQFAYVDCLPRNLESKFPIYANFILSIRNDAVRRNELFEPAKIAWYQVTKIIIPDICVERILYFLNNWSLKALIDVAEMGCDNTST